MRVAALIDTYQVSGPGRQLVATVPLLQSQGVEVEVVLFHREGRRTSPFERYLQEKGCTHWVIRESGPADLSTVRQLKRILRERDVDLLQTHGYKPNAVALLARAFGNDIRGRPWLAFFHGSTRENMKVHLYNVLDRHMLPRADHVIAMSELHASDLAERCKAVSVIYNAVLDNTIPSNSGIPAKSSDSRRTILCAGRLSHEKGVDVLIEAMAQLPLLDNNVSLLIAGDGPERANLERDVERLGLKDSVTFLGHLDDTNSAYAQADILVIPSRSEGLPNVLLESLKYRMPIVATKVGAIPEVLTGFRYAQLCEAGSALSLRNGLLGALSAPLDVESSAYDMLSRRFGLAARCAGLVNVYRHLTMQEDCVSSLSG